MKYFIGNIKQGGSILNGLFSFYVIVGKEMKRILNKPSSFTGQA